MHYTYYTMQGRAILNKGDDHRLVKIGTFKTEAEALAACRAHYERACKALANLGKPAPEVFYA